MIYLIAFVVLVVTVVGLWRMIGPKRSTSGPRPRVLAPDDDPDFLAELDRRVNPDDEVP